MPETTQTKTQYKHRNHDQEIIRTSAIVTKAYSKGICYSNRSIRVQNCLKTLTYSRTEQSKLINRQEKSENEEDVEE